MTCEWCEKPLSDEYRYTEAELAVFDAAMAQIDRDRREKQVREDEERQKAAQMTTAMVPFFFIGL